MAQKKKAATAAKTSSTTVTRIKAADDTAPTKTKKQVVTAEVVPAKKPRRKPSPKGILRPFVATGGYFKGAWTELKLVRWPTRSATWGLTFAVIAYSAFFVLLVLLLDALFKYLFELILGK